MGAGELRRAIEPLDGDSLVPVRWVRETLGDPDPAACRVRSVEPEPTSWRERLWTCHEETRLTLAETAEALDRSLSWAYKRSGPRGVPPLLPVRRLEGEVTVTAGDLRAWIQAHETREAA